MLEHTATIGGLIAATLVKTLDQQAQSTLEALRGAEQAVACARQAAKGMTNVRHVRDWDIAKNWNLSRQANYWHKKGTKDWTIATQAADDAKVACARIQTLIGTPGAAGRDVYTTIRQALEAARRADASYARVRSYSRESLTRAVNAAAGRVGVEVIGRLQ